MKLKTAELEGWQLDTAVAMALGVRQPPATAGDENGETIYRYTDVQLRDVIELREHYAEASIFAPSSVWNHGGPIIERERITITSNMDHGWTALCGCPADCVEVGATPLIAAMRAYVSSKFGEEVPEREARLTGDPWPKPMELYQVVS